MNGDAGNIGGSLHMGGYLGSRLKRKKKLKKYADIRLSKEWTDIAREAAARARAARANIDEMLLEHPYLTAIGSGLAANFLSRFGIKQTYNVRNKRSAMAWHPKMSEGWRAHRKGVGAHDNPHPVGSKENKYWAYGWKLSSTKSPFYERTSSGELRHKGNDPKMTYEGKTFHTQKELDDMIAEASARIRRKFDVKDVKGL